jgi:hypothetical protein
MWPCRAGIFSKLMLQVWLDRIPSPLGIVTVIGQVAACRFVCGLVSFRKSSVQPESRAAKLSVKAGGVRLLMLLT